ncbi:MAG: ABC transporter permease, partial [Chloroflexota bacterium]
MKSASSLIRQRLNWTLFLGAAIVLVTVFLAVFGPWLAPHDPMQENYALSSHGRIHSPPYRPLEIEGYPLGTDNFGRDMLSRILCGIRPTLAMVVVVAGVRLLLALAIGMAAGWSSGRRGQALEALISGAISLPVLIVALIVISAVGIQGGLGIFILGLALNGWAESAHLVNGKTREVRHQAYINASRALGAGNFRIIVTHVARQILPMTWMLMAYEISSTLLVTAELGFLGYYIGGGVNIEIYDFQSVNTLGLPELGQMLATSIQRLTEPTVLVVTGSVIFVIILGFNLLGDGLRREITVHHTGRALSNPFFERIAAWYDWRFLPAVEAWFRRHDVRYALLAVAVLVGIGL